jgi:SulP family sulfate permease
MSSNPSQNIEIRRRRSSSLLPARSHIATRLDPIMNSPTRNSMTSAEVRQQTMSWTYKELSCLDTLYSKSPTAVDSPPKQVRISETVVEFDENRTDFVETANDDLESQPLLPTRLPDENILQQLIYSIPAVSLAVMLTILDALSYGIIIFPSSDPHIPSSGRQAGISMFLASTIISQIVYTGGGSKFKGAVGSMMIEVMPFLHIICAVVEQQMKASPDSAILATIMVSYASSTIITGLVFLLLGVFKLGNVIQFFPRHILVGCIGGIGLFLLFTAIEVTSKVEPSINFHFLLEIFQLEKFVLWGSSLGAALVLKLLQHFIHHPLLVPIFYASVPILFYIFVLICSLNLDHLRQTGWLFQFDTNSDVPFYTFWTFYDFAQVNWSAVLATFPTQLALTFFGILHVPINVPALSVSTKQDVNLSQEIIGHGISNLLSGFSGGCQNYMVYSNSLLYIRSGGDSTISGVLLTLATILIWIKGSWIISYVPTIVVGSLIFHLGIDLLKESVFDTWSVGMHPLEYFTIVIIVLVMGIGTY